MIIDRNNNFVAVTDQSSGQIIVFDLKDENWGNDQAARWRWSARSTSGFEKLEAAWGVPTDAKIRANKRYGGLWMVVTDSLGLAALVPYPRGDHRKWGLNVGGNPHSAELLPNGNIAVAASTGGWLRVYAASQGPDAKYYAQYALPGAHGVQWDPERQILWAVGDDELVALEITGTDACPIIRAVHQAALPTRFGHDLQPVNGNSDRLWISTGTHVYQYIKSEDKFDESYAGHSGISRSGVKSIGNFLSNQVISTVPDQKARLDLISGKNDWCTESIDIFHVGINKLKVVPGSAIYKARVWISDYQ